MEGLSLDVVKQLGPETEAATRRGPGLLHVVRGQHALRRWAIVSLIMNILIVVTGGLVRLTALDWAVRPGRDAPRTLTSHIRSSASMVRSSSGTGYSPSFW